jgi:NAD(P)-dependent dehydrogenase (short-subunit alcohol dehydrogenase family)
MSEPTSAERPVALITGASYGIGGTSAAALAEDGFDIVVTELDKADLAETVDQVEAAGSNALALTLDVREQASIEQCFDDAIAKFGHVDLLVNNAGVPTPRKPIIETTRADWYHIIDVNLTGAYFMAQQFARRLIDQGRPGQVINLSSTFAFVAMPKVSVYGISKAAISGMTRNMAIEWAELGIRANAVAPGATTTKSREESHSDPVHVARVQALIPLRRFGEAEDTAAAIRYLASPGAAYVNGHTLVIDGGFTIA